MEDNTVNSCNNSSDKCAVDSSSKPLVSVVMPAYRLSRVISYSMKAVEKVLSSNGYRFEIVVVDDGSPDDTYSQALKASKNPVVRVYRLPRNVGKGFALLYGFRRSRGDIAVFFDADLDIDPRQITLLVEALLKSGADIAITSKWHPQSKTIATPLRKFLSKSFYALTKLLLGLKVSDTQTGAKAFRREVLEDITRYLTVKRYAFDVELLTAATARGYKIVEVPALWRIKLRSKFRVKEIIRMFVDLMAVTYRHRVKKQYAGSVKQ